MTAEYYEEKIKKYLYVLSKHCFKNWLHLHLLFLFSENNFVVYILIDF
jgi:hypothetical protein